MNRIINFELAGNPLNWVIVALMLAFAAFAITSLLNHQGAYGP